MKVTKKCIFHSIDAKPLITIRVDSKQNGKPYRVVSFLLPKSLKQRLTKDGFEGFLHWVGSWTL